MTDINNWKPIAKAIAAAVAPYAHKAERLFHNDAEYLPSPFTDIETAAKQIARGYISKATIKEVIDKQKDEIRRKEGRDDAEKWSETGRVVYFYLSDLKTKLNLEEAKPPYNQRDHYHCWSQENPPCGLKGKHRCCLCGLPPKED